MIVFNASLSYNHRKLIGEIMISYIKNIKNPALKCFMQIFPLFVVFFIWKDFGNEIGHVITSSFLKTSSFFSPIFRFAGEYILALLVFITLWSTCVFSKVAKTESELSIVKFWKNIAHAALIPLFLYCVLFIIDTLHFIDELPIGQNKEATDLTGLVLVSGLIALVSIVAHIFLFGTMSNINKERDKQSDYS